MNKDILARADQRGITRLCHFTPSRNLIHILSGVDGIVPTATLSSDVRTPYTPTDQHRFDGHLGHNCCTIEYPNAWYFDSARSQDELFRDWSIVFIDRSFLWNERTKFCPHNAARGRGRNAKSGTAAFDAMFAERVEGQRTFVRGPNHLPCSPTDDQAEVLVEGAIRLEQILGIAVRNEEQARNEIVRLRYAGGDPSRFRYVIAPDFYNKTRLSNLIRRGQRPVETVFVAKDLPTGA